MPASTFQSQSVTVGTVPKYNSPALNIAGYTSEQILLWPRDWFGDAARAAGGNAFALATAISGTLATIDGQIQGMRTSERLQTSAGGDIDLWAVDFLGNTISRNTGETDAAYITRIESLLTAQKGTRPGVLVIAGQYGTAWIDEPFMPGETGAFDVNGVLAYDSVGGYGDVLPLMYVFVAPSSSQTAAQAAQMKSMILASKPAGVNCIVVSVSGTTGTIL